MQWYCSVLLLWRRFTTEMQWNSAGWTFSGGWIEKMRKGGIFFKEDFWAATLEYGKFVEKCLSRIFLSGTRFILLSGSRLILVRFTCSNVLFIRSMIVGETHGIIEVWTTLEWWTEANHFPMVRFSFPDVFRCWSWHCFKLWPLCHGKPWETGGQVEWSISRMGPAGWPSTVWSSYVGAVLSRYMNWWSP